MPDTSSQPDTPKKKRLLAVRLLMLVFALLLLAVILIGTSRWYYRLETFLEADADGTLVTFSVSTQQAAGSALVGGGGQLTLSLPKALARYVDIHYTLDGSPPTRQSPRYTGPVALESGDARGCWTAGVLLCQGDTTSEVYTQSYFPQDSAVYGQDVLIVCISGEADDFYSEERGILADGPSAAADEQQANYYQRGSEWERPVTLEVFSAAGQRLLTQRAGVRVTGATSRRYEQKSLRLYARSRYDEAHPNFSIASFWPLTTSDGSSTPVVAIDHIDLRNGGSDWPYSMLTDATMRTLAIASGLAPVGEPRPAAVYLNGEFYGLSWMQPDYCEDNLAALCNLQNPDGIEVLDPGEGVAASEDFPAGSAAYQAMYALAMQDLTLPANAAALEAVLDVDNFLLYYILEMYANNDDWPHSNYKAWRYAGASAAEVAANPYADGRWRFLFYDLDIAFGALTNSVDGFAWLLRDDIEGLGNSPMLLSVLKNEDYRSRFVNIWCRLLSTTLSPANAQASYEQLRTMIEGEMQARQAADAEALNFNAEVRAKVLAQISSFIASQPGQVMANLREYFDMETTYRLHIESPTSGGTIYFAAAELAGGQQHSGTYFREAPLTLRFALAEGTRFTGWEVNGTLLYDEVLRLEPNSFTGSITVRLLVRPTAGTPPLLDGFSYRNQYNWLQLANRGQASLSLSGHYLVIIPRDGDGDEAVTYPLPDATLAGGDVLRVYEQDTNFEHSYVGSYIGGFELKRGVCVQLFGPDGTLLEQVSLPAKRTGHVYMKNPNAPGWRWLEAETEAGAA